jgi:hypothetical protein
MSEEENRATTVNEGETDVEVPNDEPEAKVPEDDSEDKTF